VRRNAAAAYECSQFAADFARKPLIGQRFKTALIHATPELAKIETHPPRFMTKRNILSFPDPRLHTVAKPVQGIDTRIRTLVADMLETMYDASGIGLAATQIDVHERLVVLDISEERNQPMVLINPEIVWASDEKVLNEEGCLSVPGIYDGVERSTSVRVNALDADGEMRTIEADGLLAVCIQHELDHLLGKVFVEYLSPLKRNRIKGKLLKQQREDQRVGSGDGRR
jgi:peptide deformylase